MKNGCDRSLKNIYGETASQKALEMDNSHISDFIDQYPETRRKFPKFKVRLNVEEKLKK